MLRVKVCGMTRLQDALLASELGADALGFIFYQKSPRNITIPDAANIINQLPDTVSKIGVFVNPSPALLLDHIDGLGLDAVQIHGEYEIDDYLEIGARRLICARQMAAGFNPESLTGYGHKCAALLLDGF